MNYSKTKFRKCPIPSEALHFGEEALDELMKNCGGFEGNAQTLRILTKLEKKVHRGDSGWGIEKGKDIRIGLNLTFRTLASILKYDYKIPFYEIKRKKKGVVKGYYRTEEDIVRSIKKHVSPGLGRKKFKTIECQIMDLADDIAYSTYDLEDCFKAGFLSPLDLLCASESLIEIIIKKLNELKGLNIKATKRQITEKFRNFFDGFRISYEIDDDNIIISNELIDWLHSNSLLSAGTQSKNISQNGYDRTHFTSTLVGEAVEKVRIKKIDRDNPELTEVELEREKLIDVEILKTFVFETQILSPKNQIFSIRSREIIQEIFKALTANNGYMLLPKDFKTIYQALGSKSDKQRVICDFIAGMTDNYAIEFYGRLKGINPQTIFKPMS